MYEIRRAMLVGEEEVDGRKLYKYLVYRFLTRTRGYRVSTINELCKEYLNETLPHIVDQYRINEYNYLVLDKKMSDIQNESIEIINKLRKYKNDKRILQLLNILNVMNDNILILDYTYICR
jgi:ActR/RegA family two-component response regulator